MLILLALFLALCQADIPTVCPDATWSKFAQSCWKFFPQRITRAQAWDYCRDSSIADDQTGYQQAVLASPENAHENDVVSSVAAAGNAALTDGNLKYADGDDWYFWVSGFGQPPTFTDHYGWQRNGTNDPSTFSTDDVQLDQYVYTNWDPDYNGFGGQATAWMRIFSTHQDHVWQLVADNTWVYDTNTGWDQNTDANPELELHPFVCELDLQSCYQDTAFNTVWDAVATDTTVTMDCPAGFTGQQTRYCNTSPTWEAPNTENCAEAITTGVFQDATMDTGLGWNTPSKALGDRYGEFTVNDVDFSKNWQIADSDTTNNLLDFPYLRMQFNFVTSATFPSDQEITVDVNSETWAVYSNLDAGADNTFNIYIPREDWTVESSFSVTFKEGLTSSNHEYHIKDIEFELLSREALSKLCYDQDGFKNAVRFPTFDIANSGFLDGAADTISLKFSVPRQLYANSFEFTASDANDNSNCRAECDYVDKYGQADTTGDNRATTLWSSTRRTTNNANCDAEEWTGAIPWTTFQNVWTAQSDFQTFLWHEPVTHENSTYYVLTAEIVGQATEYLKSYDESETTGRVWEQERTSTWRYPFGLKWRRTIQISDTFTAKACLTGDHAICTVRHVTAIVSYIQTETFPLEGRTSRTYGRVEVGIKTKVAYPYMFISGTETDDPGLGQSVHADGDLSAQAMAYGRRWADYTRWGPPTVTFAPATVNGNPTQIALDGDGYLHLNYSHEATGSCDHDPAQAVEYQVTKECEQNWYLRIVPIEDSCYIDGTYTIYFYARCFKEKPVCVFVQDNNNVWQNGVTTELTLTSNNMCPELIEQIDLTGQLCAVGLDLTEDDGANLDASYLKHNDACPDDRSFVQGEDVKFRVDTWSSKAVLLSVEIKEIFITQDYSVWNIQSNIDANLIPRFDTTYDSSTQGGKVSIWNKDNDGTNFPISLAFNDGGDAIEAAQRKVIMGVFDSGAAIPGSTTGETFAIGAAQDDSTPEAGFTVRLNKFIFPTAHDTSSDLYFTVNCKVVYVGMEADPNTGILSDVANYANMGGRDQNYCQGKLDADYSGDVSLMCAQSTFQEECPDLCVRRRHLQAQTRLTGGDEYVEFQAVVNMRPQKAQINGRVTVDDSHVRFVIEMKLLGDLVGMYNEQQEVFHQRMEYHLSLIVSAIPGQFKCSFIESSGDGISVVVDIQALEGLDQEKYSPYAIANKIEYAISTGEINDDIWFKNTIVSSLTYQAVDDPSINVGPGLIDGINEDGVWEVSLLVAVALLFSLF